MSEQKKRWWRQTRTLFGIITVAVVAAIFWSFQWPSYPTIRNEEYLHFTARGYSLDLADDGRFVAIGVGGDNLQQSDTSLFLLLNQNLYFSGVSAKVSQWTSQIKFVSNDYGFLVARSIDPGVREHENWPVVPASLERFGLDGNREVVVDSLPAEITSLSVSPDRQLAAVGIGKTDRNGNWDASVRVYSLKDGTLISEFASPNVVQFKVAFTKDSKHCLAVAESGDFAKMNIRDFRYAGMRAYLISASDAVTVQEQKIHNISGSLYQLICSPETDEAFVAFHGEIGRFALADNEFTYETFQTDGAFHGGMRPQWMDYNAATGRLAVGESYAGTYDVNATWFMDVKSRKKFRTRIDGAGDLRFSRDGDWLYLLGGGISRYYMRDLDRLERGI